MCRAEAILTSDCHKLPSRPTAAIPRTRYNGLYQLVLTISAR